MKDVFEPRLLKTNSLDEAAHEVVLILAELRTKHDNVGLVSGIISSDGEEHIQRNILRLEGHTVAIRATVDYPVFSTTDVLTKAVYDHLRIFDPPPTMREEYLRKFWRHVLASRHANPLFFTPRWNESIGAVDEHDAAQEYGLGIHYITEEV